MRELHSASPLVFFSQKNRTIDNPFVVDIDGVTLECLQLKVENPIGTVICFHGNGEAAQDYLSTFGAMFVDLGMNVLVAEYRGYGRSSGISTLNNILVDAEKIYNALALNPEEIIVFGRSMGALPAIHIASMYQTQGLILDNGIFDLFVWLKQLVIREQMEYGSTSIDIRALSDEIKKYFNNEEKISGYQNSIKLFHSQNENSLAPIGHAENLIRCIRSSSYFNLVRIGNAGHNDSLRINEDLYLKEIKSFIQICFK